MTQHSIIHQFAIVPLEAITDPELTPAEFRLLSVLYSFRDSNANTVWPKAEKIAGRANYADKTQVSKMVTRLVKKGWVARVGKNGSWGSQKYRLTVPERLMQSPEVDQNTQFGQTTQIGNLDPCRNGQGAQIGQESQIGQNDHAELGGLPNTELGGLPNTIRTDQLTDLEHINNPVPDGTAAVAAPPVDNFNLTDLARIYQSVDPESEIHSHGVPLLTRSGVEFGAARNFLKMLINKHGLGQTLDAVIVSLIENPVEPKSYLQAVAAKIGDEIPKDWVPPGPCLSEIAAMGIPDHVMREARDVFVVWFREMGIRHNNFPELFIRWCRRDWERAEANQALYRKRLQASAGFGEMFNEPA